MKLVLDTNILFKDTEFNSAELTNILKYRDYLDVELMITKVTIDELIGNFNWKLEEDLDTLKKKIGESKKLFAFQNKQRKENIIHLIEECSKRSLNYYSEALDQFIKKYKVEIIDYPKVEHSTVIQRIYQKLLPFANSNCSEKGYKDFLIIKSIEEWILKTDFSDDVYLVTNNIKDFCEIKSNPHEENCLNLSNDYSCYKIKVYDGLRSVYENLKGNLKFVKEEIEIDIAEYTKFLEKYFTSITGRSELIPELWAFDITDYKVSISKFPDKLKCDKNENLLSIDNMFEFEVRFEIDVNSLNYSSLDLMKPIVDMIMKYNRIKFDTENLTDIHFTFKINIEVIIEHTVWSNDITEMYNEDEIWIMASEHKIINPI